MNSESVCVCATDVALLFCIVNIHELFCSRTLCHSLSLSCFFCATHMRSLASHRVLYTYYTHIYVHLLAFACAPLATDENRTEQCARAVALSSLSSPSSSFVPNVVLVTVIPNSYAVSRAKPLYHIQYYTRASWFPINNIARLSRWSVFYIPL